MGRRTFFYYLLKSLKAMPFLGLLPDTLSRAAIGENMEAERHYKSLEGTSLRDIAFRKLHHGNGHFKNPLGVPRNGRFWELLRWKLFSTNAFGDYLDEQPVVPVSIDWEAFANYRGVSVTFLKHAGVLIKDHRRHLIIDPVFDDIFWFIEDFTPFAFDPKSIPNPDHILITHGHFDHLDANTMERFPASTHVITPLGYGGEFEALGMKNRNPLDWYDNFSDKHTDITLLPCNHWTMRNPLDGPNTSLWGSYLIRTSGGYTIYVSGDTAYFEGFDQIGAEFDIDLAIFNLGAYEPRWFMAPSHMNPEETVKAFKALKAKKLMIVHWGAFRLGDEPVHFPPKHIRQILSREGLLEKWVYLKPGETYFTA